MHQASYDPRYPGEPPAARAFTLGDVFAAMLRHWFVVLLATIIGGAAGYWLAVRLPDRYAAEVTLISDAGRSGIITAGGNETVSIVDPSATITIVETIGSPIVISRALDALPPEMLDRLTRAATADDSPEEGAPVDTGATLRRFISRNIEVVNSGRSYVIGVRYRSPDPELSAAIANAVARAYLEYRAELKRDVYARMLNDLGGELDSLQADLTTADRTAQAMREQARLLAIRTEALTGRFRDAAVDENAALYSQQREAEREAEATATVYERLLLTQRDIQSRLATPDVNVQLFSPAIVPTRPSGFNAKPAVLLIGLAGGFLAGTSLAVLWDARRRNATTGGRA